MLVKLKPIGRFETMTPKLERNEELTLNLGRTWNGLEFLRIRRYKRKQGCRVDFLERRWNGGWRTIWTWHCLTAEDVIKNLRRHAGLVLDEADVRRLESFFGGVV